MGFRNTHTHIPLHMHIQIYAYIHVPLRMHIHKHPETVFQSTALRKTRNTGAEVRRVRLKEPEHGIGLKVPPR